MDVQQLCLMPPPHFDDGGGGGIKRTRKVLSVPNGCTYSLVKGKN